MSVDCDSFDGQCDIWEESVRKARKDHRCDACSEPIRKGDLYHATRSLFDGSWTTTYRCARCETMYRFLGTVMKEGEVCHEELDCGHAWSEKFDSPPPDDVAALAFMTPAEAQALLASDGARSRFLATRAAQRDARRFRSTSRYWFHPYNRDHREWRARARAEQEATDATPVQP